MSEYETIRSMVLNFRLSELQSLLSYAGQNRNGRKTELQNRALQLIRGSPRDICSKVKELSNAMCRSLSSASSVNPYSPNYDSGVTMRETRSRSSLSVSQQPQQTQQQEQQLSPSPPPPQQQPQQQQQSFSQKQQSRKEKEKAPSYSSSTYSSSKSSNSTSTLSDSTSKTSSHTSSSSKSSLTSPFTSSPSLSSSASNSASKSSHTSSGYSTSLQQHLQRKSSSSDFIPLNYSMPAASRLPSGSSHSSGYSSHYSAYSSSSGYQPYKPSSTVSTPASLYPLSTDVKLRRLPFYDIEAILLNPASLQPKGTARMQEQTFSFHLTPAQAAAIAASGYRDEFGRSEYKKQIQLRFSLMETSCEQDDYFPSSLCVKVNGRLQTLPNPIPTNKPGVEPKRPPKPLNITPLCKLLSTVANYVNVSWATEPGRGYTISVYYVTKLTSEDLLQRLKRKGMRLADYTRAVIKDKLNDKDSEIATTSCKVSLACPLGKMRMTLPCRASTCDHLQCFDANLYIKMNEKKPKWLCPVCNKPALYDNLLLDGFFSEVLMSPRLPREENEIVLHQDSSWEPMPAKKDKPSNMPPRVPQMSTSSNSSATVPKVETLSVEDDDQEAGNLVQLKQPTNVVKPPQEPVIDCITLDSDSEDEIAPPLNKRPRITGFLDDDEETSSSSSIMSSLPLTSTDTSPHSSESMPPPAAPPRPSLLPPPQTLPMALLPGSSSPPLICLDDDDD